VRSLNLVIAMMLSGSVYAQPYTQVPEQPGTNTGYESPEAAERALRVKPGVTLIEKDGWLFFADKAERTFWNIALRSNRAYPTAVKRALVGEQGALRMDMKVQCGASKEACDDVVRAFQALNDEIIRKSQPTS